MRILVTGAAGFIGFHLARALAARGDAVIGIDNLNDYYAVSLKQDRLAALAAEAGDRFTFNQVDFADMAALEAALAGQQVDRVVHLGAQAGVRYSIQNPHAYVQSNLVGHLNLLEFARHRQLDHLVYASSSSVYGGNAKLPFAVEDRSDHPVSLYAATKRADELVSESYAHLYRLPQTGLRFFTVYGPWGRPDMMLWIFTKAILAGQPIPVFNDGEMYRDFTYIDDLIEAIVRLTDRIPQRDAGDDSVSPVAPYRIVNIGGGKPVALLDFIDTLEQAIGKKAIRNYLDMQKGDVPRTFASAELLERLTGYRPDFDGETCQFGLDSRTFPSTVLEIPFCRIR